MKTNEIKKGTRVQLRNGFYATILDNKKGNIRNARVEGYSTEVGSVYAHDIVLAQDQGKYWQKVEHTPQQKALRTTVEGALR